MKKNLILTGMMGVGKSTIGRCLAERLKLKFIDIDKLIERQEEGSINTIFKSKGEEYFRRVEKETTLITLKNSRCVIALGGGAFMDSKIRNEILKNAVSFWLDLDIKILLKRLAYSKKRPLLDRSNLQENLSAIYKKRKPIYNLANFKINCNNVSKFGLTKEISKKYDSQKNKC